VDEEGPAANLQAEAVGPGDPEAELAAIEGDVRAQVDAATEAARKSPPPPVELAFTQVWADGGFAWRN